MRFSELPTAIKSCQTLRRALRQTPATLRSHYRMLLAAALLGGLIGHGWSARGPHVYRGRLELASRSASVSAHERLPDSVALRRLAFDSESLRELGGTVGARRLATPQMNALASDAPPDGTVWQVEVEIPARNQRVAIRRLHRYAEKLQSLFERSAERSASKPIATSGAGPADVGFGDHPTSLEREWTRLQVDAQRLDISLETLPDTLEAARVGIDRLRDALRESDRRWVEGLYRLRRLESSDLDDAMASEPALDDPELAALRAYLRETYRTRLAYAARLTASHPRMRTLDRSIASTRESLRARLIDLSRSHRIRIARSEAESTDLRDRLLREEDQYGRLTALESRRSDLDKIRSDTGSRVARRPHPMRAGARLPDGRVPLGRLLVAPPSVEPSTLGPSTASGATIGSLAGFLAVAGVLFVFRCRDERVRDSHDVEQLDLGLAVLASIPSSRSTTATRWTKRFAYRSDFDRLRRPHESRTSVGAFTRA